MEPHGIPNNSSVVFYSFFFHVFFFFYVFFFPTLELPTERGFPDHNCPGSSSARNMCEPTPCSWRSNAWNLGSTRMTWWMKLSFPVVETEKLAWKKNANYKSYKVVRNIFVWKNIC